MVGKTCTVLDYVTEACEFVPRFQFMDQTRNDATRAVFTVEALKALLNRQPPLRAAVLTSIAAGGAVINLLRAVVVEACYRADERSHADSPTSPAEAAGTTTVPTTTEPTATEPTTTEPTTIVCDVAAGDEAAGALGLRSTCSRPCASASRAWSAET